MRETTQKRVIRLLLGTLLATVFSSLAAFTTLAPAASAAPTSTDFSLSFNGTSQYAGVANQQIIPASPSVFTVEAWVYVTSANPTYGTIVSQGNGTSQFYLKYSNGSYIMYRNGWGTEASCGIGPLNAWTHIAVVISTTTQTCYINGALSASFTYGTSNAIGSNYFMIGQWTNAITNAGTYFGGQIDEVKIWSSDRSANIASDMHSYNPSSSGLTAYFDFNEGSGTTLINRATGASAATNLTFTGSPTYTSIESSTIINGDQVVIFPRTYLNSNGGWQIPSTVTAMKSLVVAGGGAGGGRAGGGGGAGGYVYDASLAVTAGSMQSIVVGQGGIGLVQMSGGVGQNSSLGSLRTTLGGGGGGMAKGYDDTARIGTSGGSGGGASGSYVNAGTSATVGSGTQFSTYGYGSGNNGGQGISAGNWPSGGGGGANLTSGTGGNGNNSTSVAGKGGNGISDPIGGTTTCYATGGGGGVNAAYTPGAGGDCAGSATPNNNAGTAGNVFPGYASANTGAGGGGGGFSGGSDPAGGWGASGIIILRYPLAVSVSISYSGGTQATFRAAGTITATATMAGKVTFYDRGKVIPGCKNISTNGSFVATCTWKPSLHGLATLTASAKPANSYVPASSSPAINIVVSARSGNR